MVFYPRYDELSQHTIFRINFITIFLPKHRSTNWALSIYRQLLLFWLLQSTGLTNNFYVYVKTFLTYYFLTFYGGFTSCPVLHITTEKSEYQIVKF